MKFTLEQVKFVAKLIRTILRNAQATNFMPLLDDEWFTIGTDWDMNITIEDGLSGYTLDVSLYPVISGNTDTLHPVSLED